MRDLDVIEATANAAAPPPWVVYGDKYLWSDDDRDGGRMAVLGSEDFGESAQRNNAAFMTAARTDVPDLIAEIRLLQDQLRTSNGCLLSVLQAIETLTARGRLVLTEEEQQLIDTYHDAVFTKAADGARAHEEDRTNER